MRETPESSGFARPEMEPALCSEHEPDADMEACINETAKLLREFGLPVWRKDKKIDCVYRVRFGYHESQCPECLGDTTQYVAELSCSTDQGIVSKNYSNTFICEPCSTMVLDEAPVDDEITRCGFTYLFPLGIRPPNDDPEVLRDHEPDNFFRFFEGTACVVVPDEHEALQIIPEKKLRNAFGQFMAEVKKREHKKRKRKLQKQARQKSRKK